MKKLTTLFLIVFMLLGSTGTAYSYDTTPFINALEQLESSGKMSTEHITNTIIDLSQIESQGTVYATVYEGVYEENTFNEIPNLSLQTYDSCTNKLTRFVFELSNQYRPEGTFLSIGLDRDIFAIHVRTFGDLKTQAMYAFVSGIPDCLNNAPYSHHSGSSSDSSNSSTTSTNSTSPNSWIDKYSPAQMATKTITSFKINDATYVFNDKPETMDIVPYAKDNRTYVPVRYLAYALGVTPENIAWNQTDQTVTVTLDKTTVAMTIGSTTMTVNGTSTTMDVAPEAVDGRTMLPARYLAEAFGATATWNPTSESIEITKPGN